jgi:adenylate cyclase
MHPLSDQGGDVRRILIVDDEPDILDSLKELLEAAVPNVEVLTAPSGEDAVAQLGEANIKLLVTDFKMPGMNGMELLRHARDKVPRVPRILMTAFPDLQIAIQAINEAAIQNFFTKPLDPDEVLRVIGEMLDEREASLQRDRAFARAMDLMRKGGS